MAELVQTISPLDERIIGSYAITSCEELSQQMETARVAAATWADYSVKQRVDQLSQLKAHILTDCDLVTAAIMAVTGKVKTEVLLGEIYPVLELLRYYA